MEQKKVFFPEWLKTYMREVAQANREQPLTEKEWGQVFTDIHRERALRAELERIRNNRGPVMRLF